MGIISLLAIGITIGLVIFILLALEFSARIKKPDIEPHGKFSFKNRASAQNRPTRIIDPNVFLKEKQITKDVCEHTKDLTNE